jgi:uncharacterized repeat protein (TIGR02543 family)
MVKRAICAAVSFVLCLSLLAFLPLQVGAVDMKVSDACVELIKQLEGFTAIPKWDYSQWTVGFGTSCPADLVDRYKQGGIPIADAEQLLAEKLVYFDECVNRFINKNNLKLTQGQYDAIFSLTYNCGASWLNKSEGQLYQAILNGKLGNEFIGALSAWCTAGGNFLHGLMMRRLAEAEMYLYGKYDTEVPDYYCYVKFDANGGQRTAAGQGYDSRYAAPVMQSATYPGYRFLGWFTEPTGGVQVTNLEKGHDRITLYAHWQKSEATQSPSEPVTVTVTTNNLNIRAGAGTGYDVIGQVHAGDQLKITETAAVDGEMWGKCELGWTCLTYTDYDLVISGGSAGEKVMATITASAVNVRSGPGASYSRVATLHGGDRVEILEQRTVDGRIWGRFEKGWFRISGYASVETDSGDGGSSGEQTPGYTPVGPTGPGTPPVDNPNPTFPKSEVEVPKAPNKVLVLGKNAVVIRTGPHKSYPEVGQYPLESRVDVLEFMYFMGDIWARTDKGWFCMNRDVLIWDDTMLNRPVDVTITLSSLYVRTGPGTEHQYVRTVKKGTVVKVYAVRKMGDSIWGRIDVGWISLKHTTFDESMIPEQPPQPDCNTTGHRYGATVKQPTCTENGYTTHVCEKCGHSYTDGETAALGHKYADTVVAPTCAEKGYTSHVCSTCGHSYRDSETVALGHQYNTVVTDPTCAAGGYTTHTCSVCGHSYQDAETAALQHSYQSVVTPPTTKDQGYTTHTCDNCGHSYKDSYTDPIKNTVTVTVTKTYATITAGAVNVRSGAGASFGAVGILRKGDKVQIYEQKDVDGRIWGRCDKGWFRMSGGYASLETITETYEVEVEGCQHTYTHTLTKPTCDLAGFTTHTCSKCGHSYRDSETAALGHKYTSVVTPPTATAQGYTTHTCGNCGHSYKDSYTDAQKPETETVTKVYATITAGTVNVRKGPGASYGAVTVLRRGAVVEILEQKEVDGRIWCRFEKGWFRLTGYATLKTVTEEVEVSKPQQPVEPEKPIEPEKPSEPEQPAEPEKPETTKKTYATITVGAVNVRNGAGASYSAVGILRKGDKVEIYEQKDVDGRIWGRCDKGWFRMSGGYASLETVEA